MNDLTFLLQFICCAKFWLVIPKLLATGCPKDRQARIEDQNYLNANKLRSAFSLRNLFLCLQFLDCGNTPSTEMFMYRKVSTLRLHRRRVKSMTFIHPGLSFPSVMTSSIFRKQEAVHARFREEQISESKDVTLARMHARIGPLEVGGAREEQCRLVTRSVLLATIHERFLHV